jgi:hypothetical protein
MPTRIVFKTSPDGTDTLNERMRIQANGFVGIGGGGTTAYYPLHVYNNSDGIITRWRKQGATNNPLFEIELTESDSSTILRTSGSNVGPMIFQRGSSEAMRITTNQVVLIGATESRTVQGFATRLQVEGTAATDSSVQIVRNSNDINPPYINFGKTRGSVGGVTAVSNNDILGEISWGGADGNDLNNVSATIQGVAEATATNNDTPGRLVFKTTAAGAGASTERMRIDNAGLIQVGGGGTYVGNARLQLSSALSQPTLRQSSGRWSKTEYGVGASGSFNTCILTFDTGGDDSTVIVESDVYAYNGIYLNSKLGRYSNQAVSVMHHAANGSGTTIAWTQGTNVYNQIITISCSTTHPVTNFKIICGGLFNQATNVTAVWSNV